ncbi:MAG: rod shape-determining protein MreC [Alphaproteobacteria bacterium]|nr:rod shape-determining protein MreC [Alphaproteobacteria bacterium]
MKKSAPLSKRRRFYKKLQITGLVIFFVLSVAFFMGRTDLRQSIYTSVRSVTTSVFSGISYILYAPFNFLYDQYHGVVSREKTFEQNKLLRQKLHETKIYQEKYFLTESENQRLKNIVGFIPEKKSEYLSSYIYQDFSTVFSKSILIHVGAKDGIKRYAPVLAKGFLIGQVVGVYPSFSRVLLLSDSTIKIPIKSEKEGKRFFLQGDNERKGILVFPEGKPQLGKGERILTSGFQGVFPPNIPVGFVSETGKDIVIDFFVQPKDIEVVSVLKNFTSENWEKEENEEKESE